MIALESTRQSVEAPELTNGNLSGIQTRAAMATAPPVRMLLETLASHEKRRPRELQYQSTTIHLRICLRIFHCKDSNRSWCSSVPYLNHILVWHVFSIKKYGQFATGYPPPSTLGSQGHWNLQSWKDLPMEMMTQLLGLHPVFSGIRRVGPKISIGRNL